MPIINNSPFPPVAGIFRRDSSSRLAFLAQSPDLLCIYMKHIPLLLLNLHHLAGARCSSVVRVFAHGAMGCRIDPSWWIHWAISLSSQCSMTGVTKAMVCIRLSCLWDDAYKITLAANRKVAHVAAAGFLSRYLNGPLPYVWRHITVNKCVECVVK